MIYPLVLDLAAEQIPVAVTCPGARLLEQALSTWKASPGSQRDWDDAHVINTAIEIHHDDPDLGHRFLTDELVGHAHRQVLSSRSRSRSPGRPGLLLLGRYWVAAGAGPGRLLGLHLRARSGMDAEERAGTAAGSAAAVRVRLDVGTVAQAEPVVDVGVRVAGRRDGVRRHFDVGVKIGGVDV